MRLKRRMMPLAAAIVVAAVAPLVVDAQQPGYKGSKICIMCHKNTHKDLVAAWQKSGHATSMWAADQADPAAGRTIVGDFTANPGFQKADVKWVLGAGKREQAYVGADYKVLPKWWDVKAKAWKPALRWDHAAQKMAEVGTDTDARVACLGCHITGYDPATATGIELGVACEACHGPGAGHVGTASKEAIVRPQTLPPDRAAMICGQCHGHGADTSGKYAIPYAFPVDYRPGDDLAASYVVDGPAPGAFFQQYSEWRGSKHAANNVLCTSCHEPHGVGGLAMQLRKEGNALCLDCHTGKLPDNDTHKTAAEGTLKCTGCHMPGGSHLFKKPGA